MARQLKWWIVAPLGGCAAIAIADLPPRPMPLFGQRFFHVYQTFEPPTPYRMRVQELASRYRVTSFELMMREYSEAMRPDFARQRALEIPGPVLHFDGDSLSDSARALVRALLDSAWSQLGLGVTKISVGVVVHVVFDRPPGGQSPAHMPEAPAFLLPDSSDRVTCLAYVPMIYWGRPGALKNPHPVASIDLAERLRNGLGPCAYFAAFGAPGGDIADWLVSRHYALALDPWKVRVSAESSGMRAGLNPHWPGFWWYAYRYEPDAVACMAGRSQACRRTVLVKGSGAAAPIATAELPGSKPPSPAGASRYLADLADGIGPERFGRFWNSELPVDTALATAMRMPVGAWTRRWQATVVRPIRLGPAAPLGATLLATLLGIGAVLFVAMTASRRAVR